MISNLFPNGMPDWFDNALERLEQLFWNNTANIDTKSNAFYVYRAYPSSIKSSQIDDWIALQRRTLSPFLNGDSYIYAAPKGLCLWTTPSQFEGAPETAMHRSLPDGEHWVKGEVFYYQQTWVKGTMTALSIETSAPEGARVESLQSLQPGAWAKKRNIDVALSQPITWGAVAVCLFFVWVSVSVGSWIGTNTQLADYNNEISELESRLGNKLELQSAFQEKELFINGINTWQNKNGSLPKALASVITPVISQTAWQANVISWQNNVLMIELGSESLDITQLVADLETRDEFARVGIRPHTTANTWNLELVLNEPQ